jgi:hypothetical protein
MTTLRTEITVVVENPNMMQEYEEGDRDNASASGAFAHYIYFSSSSSVEILAARPG